MSHLKQSMILVRLICWPKFRVEANAFCSADNSGNLEESDFEISAKENSLKILQLSLTWLCMVLLSTGEIEIRYEKFFFWMD